MNPVAAPLNFPARRQPENRSNVHLNAWGSKRYPTLFSLSPSKHQRPENMCEHRSFYNPNRGDPKGLRLQVVWGIPYQDLQESQKNNPQRMHVWYIYLYTYHKKSAIHVGKDINPMGILWNASQKREIWTSRTCNGIIYYHPYISTGSTTSKPERYFLCHPFPPWPPPQKHWTWENASKAVTKISESEFFFVDKIRSYMYKLYK